MNGSRITFRARQSELERLYAAKHLCYLVGPAEGLTDPRNVLRLAATLARLTALSADIVPVPVVKRVQVASLENVRAEYGELFGQACFVYYSASENEEGLVGCWLASAELVELPDAPAAAAQLVVYGGDLSRSRPPGGEATWELVEALDRWALGSRDAGGERPLILLNQRFTEQAGRDDNDHHIGRLLARADAVGVCDAAAAELVRASYGREAAANLFVSGDDALCYAVWRASEAKSRAGDAGRAPADGGPRGLSVCLDLGGGTETAEATDRLLDAAASIVRDMRALRGQQLAVHLFAGSASAATAANVERLRAAVGQVHVAVDSACYGAELRDGLPKIAGSQLVVCCPSPLAAASLALGVPTVLLIASQEQAREAEELQRVFGVPEEMLLDLRHGEQHLNGRLSRALTDEHCRSATRLAAAEGTTRLTTQSASAMAWLTGVLCGGYVAELERRYAATVARLRETLEQLSDLQLDHTRLLDCSAPESSAAERTAGQ